MFSTPCKTYKQEISAAEKIQHWYKNKRFALFSQNAKQSAALGAPDSELQGEALRFWKMANFDNVLLHQKYNIPSKKLVLFRAIEPYPELELVCTKQYPLLPRLYNTAVTLQLIDDADIQSIKKGIDNIRIINKIKNNSDPDFYREIEKDLDTALNIYRDEPISPEAMNALQSGTTGEYEYDIFSYFTTLDVTKTNIASLGTEYKNRQLVIILAVDPGKRELFRSPNGSEQEWVSVGAVPYDDILDIVYKSDPSRSYLKEHYQAAKTPSP